HVWDYGGYEFQSCRYILPTGAYRVVNRHGLAGKECPSEGWTSLDKLIAQAFPFHNGIHPRRILNVKLRLGPYPYRWRMAGVPQSESHGSVCSPLVKGQRASNLCVGIDPRS